MMVPFTIKLENKSEIYEERICLQNYNYLKFPSQTSHSYLLSLLEITQSSPENIR